MRLLHREAKEAAAAAAGSDLSTPLKGELCLLSTLGVNGGGEEAAAGGEGRKRVIISADRANFLSTVSGR